MSKLRQNIERAREDYESTRYPGDLAADVFRRAEPAGFGRRLLFVGGAMALAAAVAIGIFLARPMTTNNDADSTPMAAIDIDEPTPDATAETDTASFAFDSVPTMPSADVSYVSLVDWNVPSPPSFPGLDDQPVTSETFSFEDPT